MSGTAVPAHGGNLEALAVRAGRRIEDILDFSASINPLGPPAWLRPVLARALGSLVHYPSPDAAPLRQAAGREAGCGPECVVAGNGSTEILYALPAALGAKRVLIPSPAYIDYGRAALLAGLPIEAPVCDPARHFTVDSVDLAARVRPGDLVCLGHPSNPAGALLPVPEIRALIEARPDAFFLIDEAFLDFVAEAPTFRQAPPANAVVLRSLTKFWAVPGLRLGLAYAAAGIAARLRERLPPWSVNGLAQAVGVEALADLGYAERSRVETKRLREALAARLAALPGLTVEPGAANYLLVRRNGSAGDLADRLLARHGIAIRVCAGFAGLDDAWFRVAVRTEAENARLLDALADELGLRTPPATRRRRTPALMVLGTSSHAGKSLLTAAFCRMLLQDGVSVAPFKAQNMALNSFVTRDGRELGRAQALQAQACRLDPDARMNPILLKPNSQTGSQVIVLGRPVGSMTVREYHRYKPEAEAAAREAYDRLAAEHEAIVLEGAGSPAEVNLKAHDFVNLRMAGYADAPAVLVGDIDRGGVYASFVGTLEVLEEEERRSIRGFLVNKFRGDASLLAPAHEFVERFTGRPVVGVVPHLGGLGLPEEDSVGFKGGADHEASRADALDLALLDLPHIANFTDFDPLRVEPDVRLRIVRSAADLGTPDAVLLPGTKNTIDDLAWLRGSGLFEAILRLGEKTALLGICGGLQMLGRTIRDPQGLESATPVATGLGHLALDTVLAEQKILVRVEAVHQPTGLPVRGYEIHHGRTVAAEGVLPATVRADGEAIGWSSPDGRVEGTYVHGFFDDDTFRRRWLDRLRAVRGLAPVGTITPYDLEPALDRLAAAVRRGVNWPRLRAWMGL